MSNVIGRNLKVLREANDLTQEQMSSYLGIGRSAYANYEAVAVRMPTTRLASERLRWKCWSVRQHCWAVNLTCCLSRMWR